MPNGYGSVHKIGGSKQRRRPWRARVTDGWIFDETKGKAVQQFRTLGYYATKKEALVALAEYNKQPAAPGSAHITFADVYKMWLDRNESVFNSVVLSGYAKAFERSSALHSVRIHDLRTEHLQAVMDEHPNGYGSQKRLRTLWRKMYRLAIEKDFIHKNYAEFVILKDSGDSEGTRQPFSKSQIKTLWENVDKIPGIDSILIMAYSGFRPSEFLSISTERIHLAERWIDLHGTKTKAAKRAVPIHKKILPLIERVAGEKYIYEMPATGERMKYAYYLRYVWHPIIEALGFENLTPHSCRHFFISAAVEAGVNDRLLKKIVGHSTGDITGHYTHAFLDSLINEIDKIEV